MEEKKEMFVEEVTAYDKEENKKVLEAYAQAIKDLKGKKEREAEK